MSNTVDDLQPPGLPPAETRAELRERLLASLREQGFEVGSDGTIGLPDSDKSGLRALQREAVETRRERARGALQSSDKAFTMRLAHGDELDPARIRPRLIPIPVGRSDLARLWRWCSLHWEVPVSSGYGRRLRFLVVDDAHAGAVMGLIGLDDPVYSLGVRDTAIGWTPEQRRQRLTSVMDAYVLGAVPPYSHLLGGKLIAQLIATDVVRDAFRERYGHLTTRISGVDPDAHLALVTTTSALGRSSIYNRVKRRDNTEAMTRVGYTQGTGDFQFSGEIYQALAKLATESTKVPQRRPEWGSGFRNRREVVQKALSLLELSGHGMRVHGVRREVFVTRLAQNSYEWLRGGESELDWRVESTDSVSAWWLERWVLRRAETSEAWRTFDTSDWLLYP